MIGFNNTALSTAYNKSELVSIKALDGDTFDAEFIGVFCEKFIPKLREFASDYREALYNYDTITLRENVHTMTSSLRFLGLENIVLLFNQYKQIDLKDREVVNSLTQDVEDCCALIEEKLIQKMKGL